MRFNSGGNQNTEACFTITGGIQAWIINRFVLLNILLTALSAYKNPLKAISALRVIRKRRLRILGNSRTSRYIHSQGQYYFSDTIPGWPSKAFNAFIQSEIKRNDPYVNSMPPLHTVILSITNRCPLRCRHCYEWLNLDSNDFLSLTDLFRTIEKLRALNVRHIQLSGGEPLVRFDDLIEILKKYAGDCRFWLLTSGYEFSLEKAIMLKKAGLIGADISLDHWNEELHNNFRNNSNSFYWVKEAVSNCNKAGILPALSLCALNDFVTPGNLQKYLELARLWNVSMIRILEPRAAGRFSGKNVDLGEDQLITLSNFYLSVNGNAKYRNYPLIMYPGYHQRYLGCFGAGNRYFYIDSLGDIHACPFCHMKAGNAISDSIPAAISKLKKSGCQAFTMSSED